MKPLRERMIEDLQLKGYSESTQKLYVSAVRQLCEHCNKTPGKITEEDLRDYFPHVKNVKKWSRSTSTVALCGIKFFFDHTIKRPWPTLLFIRAGRNKRLPIVLSRAIEEKKLRFASDTVDAYLTFALAKRVGRKKHHFIRQLYRLYRKMSFDLFEKTILRALTYRIEDIQTIERIAVLQMKEANYQMPQIDVDEQVKNRQAYIDGRFSSEVDLSVYKYNDEDDDG